MATAQWTSEWHQRQVGYFRKQRRDYAWYAELLRQMLLRVCRKYTQYGRAEARAKSIVSYAEKAIRKFGKYQDPIHQLTDLCGARTVTFTQAEADRICEFITANFHIDWENSEDCRQRLKPDQFGYQAIHFVVQMPWMALLGRRPLSSKLRQTAKEQGIDADEILGRTGDELAGILLREAVQRAFSGDYRRLCRALAEAPPGQVAAMTQTGAAMLQEAMEQTAREGRLGDPLDLVCHIGNCKAEVQVQTALQNTWAAVGHDRLYKSQFRAPLVLERQLHRVSALLEEGDEEFGVGVVHLDEFQLDYGAYMKPERRETELLKWRSVLKFVEDPEEKLSLALKAAGLAASLEDWPQVIETLTPFRPERSVPVLRELGRARFKFNGKGERELKKAVAMAPSDPLTQCYLGELYCPGRRREPAGQSCDKALACFANAFKANPGDPMALRRYLECSICKARDAKVLALLAPALEAARKKSYDRAAIHVHMPYALYDMAEFCLLLGQPYEGLGAYAKAVYLSEGVAPIEEALESLERLARGLRKPKPEWAQHLEWGRRFLLLARVAKYRQLQREAPGEVLRRTDLLKARRQELADRREELARASEVLAELKRATAPHPPTPGELVRRQEALSEARQAEAAAKAVVAEAEAAERRAAGALRQAEDRQAATGRLADQAVEEFGKAGLESRWNGRAGSPFRNRKVVIVVGTCDPRFEQQMQYYRGMIMDAFDGFEGTISSAGTMAGVGRIIGDAQAKHPQVIQTVSYLPGRKGKRLPDRAARDPRYTHTRHTGGRRFSPLEPLQCWIDIVAAGVDPYQVKVLGIDGGEIAGCEYRMALALGACVAVLEEAGREAARLLPDEDWGKAPRLLVLPQEPAVIHEYLWSHDQASPAELEGSIDAIAQRIHDTYRSKEAQALTEKHPNVAPWDKLPPHYRKSNRDQARHYFQTLRAGRFEARFVSGRAISLPDWSSQDPRTRHKVEAMAEAEHARYLVERFLAGWRWGPVRDEEKKINPALLPWSNLPESEKQKDRAAVRDIPLFLKDAGLEIHPAPAKTNRRGRR